MKKILFVSSEVSPYAKSGGLADVAGSLPKELLKLGYDISMMVNPNTHKPCDMEKTGIGVDVDNLKNYEYKEEPLLIYLYCD